MRNEAFASSPPFDPGADRGGGVVDQVRTYTKHGHWLAKLPAIERTMKEDVGPEPQEVWLIGSGSGEREEVDVVTRTLKKTPKGRDILYLSSFSLGGKVFG